MKALDELYKTVEGYGGADGMTKIRAELTADLVGDYLFQDADFINHLSTKNRNVFEKIYDEIKYLCKVVTAGSKEARQLERAKKAFEDVYRSDTVKKTDGETKLSISKTSKMEYDVQLKQIEDGKMNRSNSLYIGTSVNLQNAGMSNAPFAMNQGDYRKSRRETANNKNYSSHSVPYDFFENLPDHLNNAPMLIDNEEKVTIVTSYPMGDTKGNDSYVIAGVWKNQTMESDTVNLIKSVYPWDDFAKRITKSAENGNLVITNKNKVEQMLTTIGIQPAEVSRILNLAKDSIPQNGKNVKPQFSLSADSNGKTLTEGKNTASKRYGNLAISGDDVRYNGDDISPVDEKPHVSMEEFANSESPVWRNVDYNDDSTKTEITRETHKDMIDEGAVVTVSEDVSKSVEESFPDLRGVKKRDRTPILKESMRKLKDNLRQFLNGFKNQGFEFEVNGRVLDAKLYNTGINEVLEKITKDKASMLYTTEEIFRNARYLYSTADYDSDPNVYRWNYFYTPVQIGDSVVGVRIAVRDTANPSGSQIYNWGIKKDTSLDGGGRGTNNRSSIGVSSDVSNNIIPQFEENVNPQNWRDMLDGMREPTDADVETKTFTKDQYDEAVAYRNSFVNQTTDNNDIAPIKESSNDGSFFDELKEQISAQDTRLRLELFKKV